MSKVFIDIAFLAAYPLLLAQQTLNNDSVVNMVKAGFSEDVIVSTINCTSGSYDTSVDGLIALKNAGITKTEISAIVAKAYAAPQNSAAQTVPLAGTAPDPRAPLPDWK